MRWRSIFVVFAAGALGCQDETTDQQNTVREKTTKRQDTEGRAYSRGSSSGDDTSLTQSKPSGQPKSIPAPPDVSEPPEDARRTPSGLRYKVLKPVESRDRRPSANDSVQVHYTGWTTDGEMFDSSRTRGRPATFGLGQVIAGWTEGLQLMAVGERFRFWIPESLAYRGMPGKPAGTLVFDVELLDVLAAPEVPENVSAPPDSAVQTASGLAYQVLKRGTGSAKPSATSRVTVHYSGWTTDGKMFDSSRTRGQPATFPLNRVIPGWTEGLQLMTKGSQYRFWIPKELAYNDRPGRPAGTLVFDVELIDFEP
ncbi:MAG: FKBP-type peptidyl-prolyl cis-trans isomerase [Myxococcota bacterium]